jgi:hypothetical protein
MAATDFFPFDATGIPPPPVLETDIREGRVQREAQGPDELKMITWKDQLNNPVYCFVRQVAGFTNIKLDALVEDDSYAMRHFLVVRRYEQWKHRLGKLINRNDGDEERVQRDIATVRQYLQQLFDSTTTGARRTYMNTNDGFTSDPTTPTAHDHQHGIFVANKLILKPAMQSALALAFVKLKGRFDPKERDKLDKFERTLMAEGTYATMYAYVVSRQLLNVYISNPLNTYKKVVDYRRVVAQENSALRTLVACIRRNGVGGVSPHDTRSTLLDYDPKPAPRLFL